MPVTFIGDVHGQMAALEELIPQCEGEIIFMGDLIDRGPHSREVVQRVRDLCLVGRASCLLGNHEFALVSSLGLPERGVQAKPQFFAAWCQVYGGYNTLLSYGVDEINIDDLREMMRTELEWMYALPWYLRRSVDGQEFIAVHAGLNDRDPLAQQLASLDDCDGWWHTDEQLPPSIYEHKRAAENPPDLSPDLCIVSGHTVQPEVFIDRNRVLCDTSGGRSGRRLSGVIWPEGRVISAKTADD